jgi:putative salt-induced outer membrane protein
MDTYPGSLGGGFAQTGGNTDTQNFNLTFGITRDPKTNNVVKANATYLRGIQNDVLNLDRSGINIRNEYSLSERTFVFGQVDYLRDKFKEIIFLWVPAAGAGYRFINNDTTMLAFDGALGGLFEKNPGQNTIRAGSITAGQRFQVALSSAATLTQSVSTIWKTNNFNDSLTNFSVGLTTAVINNLELKLEFIDSYKNDPVDIALKKNDTAFVTAFVLKY